MSKVIIIRSADKSLIVSFTCYGNCFECNYRFSCYTSGLGDVELDAYDIDKELWRLPRGVVADIVGGSDAEFYVKAFNVVAQYGERKKE